MLATPISCRQLLVVVMLVLVVAAPTVAQTWSRAFGPMGLNGDSGYDGEAYCFEYWQGWLYVGGWFEFAGDEASSHLARWNGTYWTGVDGGVNQIPEFIHGQQTALFVGGPFWEVGGEPMTYCAKWDGTWHAMDGLEQAPTCAATYNGILYIGGGFSMVEPPPWFTGLKRWNGLDWIDAFNFAFGRVEDEAHAIANFNGGIHLGGDFQRSIPGGMTYNHVAWNGDGENFTFGGGITLGYVECFEPTATGLWVGGSFQQADGQESRGLVLQGAGGTYTPIDEASTPRFVADMTMHGDRLHLAQREWTPDERNVVRTYGNGAWTDPIGGDFTDYLNCIETGPDGDLFVGGFFDNGVVRWDDDEWVHLGGGIGRVTHDRHRFHALVEFDGDIIAGGENLRLPAVLEGQIDCEDIVRWDGDAWHRMNNGLPNNVTSLAVFGGALYAGQESGVGLERLQRWDGDSWQPAGNANGQVLCLVVHDDELIAGGSFTDIDGVAVGRVAVFDGAVWRALGTGMDNTVRALFSNDGVLYAAGRFETADGSAAARVARWTGSSWEALGAGFDDGQVNALGVYGGEMFAGGSFTASGGVAVGHVARWDGDLWQPLGDGVGGDTLDGVAALLGTSTALFVGGDFETAGGIAAPGLATWDGAWSAFEGGGVSESYDPRPSVRAMLVKDGDLWIAGNFTKAGTRSSYCIARWIDGSLVPNLLAGFTATPTQTNEVRVEWRLGGELTGADYRLVASAGANAWEVPWSVGAGVFVALDTSPHLDDTNHVRYTLSYRLAGDDWRELGRTSATLSPPSAIRLAAVTPNPFNPRTRVTYTLDRAQEATVAVYDLSGRKLVILASGSHTAGDHAVTWQGTNEAGRTMASGTYFVRLETATAVRIQKATLVR